MMPQSNHNINSKRNIKSTIEGGSSMKNITKNVEEPDLDAEKTINVNKMYEALEN